LRTGSSERGSSLRGGFSGGGGFDPGARSGAPVTGTGREVETEVGGAHDRSRGEGGGEEKDSGDGVAHL
jgi:hypothetical protein